MGYHITISRNPHDPEKDPIPLEEWERFIAEDDRVERYPTVGDNRNVEFDRRSHAVAVKGLDNSWLGWSAGTIWTGHPDSELMKFMLEIAPRFGAMLHGDEGEIYRTPEECEMDWDAPLPQKTFWEREFTRENVIKMVILLAVAVLMYLVMTGRFPVE